MSTQASTSSAPPPPPSPTPQPPIMTTTARPTTAPSSLSPTIPSTSSTRTSPSIPSSLSHSISLPHSAETTRQIAEARAFLEASMNNIGSSLDHTLRTRAQNLHDNSKQLEKQQKDVVRATEGLRKENDKLAKELREGSRRVKELGNVQNWAEMLERDFLVLGETLRLVREGSESNSEWETSSEGSYSESEVAGEGDCQRGGKQKHEGDGERMDGLSNGKSVEEYAMENVNLKETEVVATGMVHEDGNVDADGDMQMWNTQHEARHEDESKAAESGVDHGQQIEDTPNGHAGEVKAVEDGDLLDVAHADQRKAPEDSHMHDTVHQEETNQVSDSRSAGA